MLQAAVLIAAAIWLASKPRRPRRALLWSAICFAADLIAIPAILRGKPAILIQELDTLPRENLSRVDALALELQIDDRKRFQRLSDRILQISVALPLLFVLRCNSRSEAGNRLLDYVWGHALTYTLYTFGPFGPAFVDKLRPIVYRPEVPIPERTNGNNRNSQYSGHTGSAAFAGVFLAREILRRQCAPAGLGFAMAVAPAVLVGSLRVRAQKHFPSDVAIASLIGAAIAIIFTRSTGNRNVIPA